MIEHTYYTAKWEDVFRSVMVDKKDSALIEGLLSNIFGGKVEILDFPKTELGFRPGLDNSTCEFLIKLNHELIHIDIETAFFKGTEDKNFWKFLGIYAKNADKNQYFNKRVKFINIVLQFGEEEKDYLMNDYEFLSEDNQSYTDDFFVKKINVDRIKKYWYAHDEENIEKYKYVIMLDLESVELAKLEKKDNLVKKFNEEVSKLNNDSEFVSYMIHEEEHVILGNTREAVAFDEGKKEKSIEIAKSLLQLGKNSIEEIAEITDLELEEVKKLI